MKIADVFTVEITNPDTHVSIADLAQFVSFAPLISTRPTHLEAYAALVKEYRAHEQVDGGKDHYDGAWMAFADGSRIHIHPRGDA